MKQSAILELKKTGRVLKDINEYEEECISKDGIAEDAEEFRLFINNKPTWTYFFSSEHNYFISENAHNDIPRNLFAMLCKDFPDKLYMVNTYYSKPFNQKVRGITFSRKGNTFITWFEYSVEEEGKAYLVWNPDAYVIEMGYAAIDEGYEADEIWGDDGFFTAHIKVGFPSSLYRSEEHT